jgi:hypothetical protein
MSSSTAHTTYSSGRLNNGKAMKKAIDRESASTLVIKKQPHKQDKEDSDNNEVTINAHQ